MKTTFFKRPTIFVIGLTLVTLTPNLPAQVVWDGSTDNAEWSTRTNWVGDILPSGTDNIEFTTAAASTRRTVFLRGNREASRILFKAANPGYTLDSAGILKGGGNTLTLTHGSLSAYVGAHALYCHLSLPDGADVGWDIGAGDAVILHGELRTASNIRKTSAGALSLLDRSGAGSFTGRLECRAGGVTVTGTVLEKAALLLNPNPTAPFNVAFVEDAVAKVEGFGGKGEIAMVTGSTLQVGAKGIMADGASTTLKIPESLELDGPYHCEFTGTENDLLTVGGSLTLTDNSRLILDAATFSSAEGAVIATYSDRVGTFTSVSPLYYQVEYDDANGQLILTRTPSLEVYVADEADDYLLQSGEDLNVDEGEIVTWHKGDGTMVTDLIYGHEAFVSIREAINAVENGGTVHLARGSHERSVVFVATDGYTITTDTRESGISLGDVVTWEGAAMSVTGLIYGYNAFTSIQEAIDVVNEGGTVYLAPGTYDEGEELTNNAKSLALMGGDAATTIITTSRNGNSILDGGEHRVLTLSGGEAVQVLLDSLTLQNGIAEEGGNLHNATSLTLKNCHIANGIATAAGGGGIYNGESPATLINCTIQGNSTAKSGGGIYNESSSVTLTSCTIQGNSAAESGGGIFNWLSSPGLANCIIQDNSAQWGGGIYNGGSQPDFTNCIIRGNSAGESGGGICSTFLSLSVLTNCIVQGNSAARNGGGIYDSFPTSTTLTNCTIQGNSARYSGGGIYNEDASPGLINCIIWGNLDESGSGTPESSVYNHTVVGSASPAYAYCLIQGLNPSGEGNLDGADSGNDPRFVDAVDPASAPTTGGDLRLMIGSPALDAGFNDDHFELFDLAGNLRVIGAGIDLGAYEGTALNQAYVARPRQYEVTADRGNGGLDQGDTVTWHGPSKVAGLIYGHNAFTSIQDAIDAVDNGGTVYLAAGTYDEGRELTNNSKGLTLLGGDPATTIITTSRNDDTTLDDGEHRVLALSGGEAVKVFLESLTLQSGIADLGGNIYNTANLTMAQCRIISGMAAVSNGGGIYSEASPLTLTNCAIQGNSAAQSGGGISSSFSPAALTNCIIQGNSAQDGGGGIYSALSPLVLTNCTIKGNSAQQRNGGGIYHFSSSPKLTNCIIWHNLGQDGYGTASSSVYNHGNAFPSYDHCLIEGLAPPGQGNLDGTDSSNDPRFVHVVDPAHAPTTDGDLRLMIGSPALDVGSVSANSEEMDLLGNDRVSGSGIDLGAHEGAALNQVYVAETGQYEVTADRGNGGLDQGDTVTWHGPSKVAGLIYGHNAFTSIQDAIDAVDNGGTVYLAAGTYDEGRELTNNSKGLTLLGGDPATTIITTSRNDDTTLDDGEHRVLTFSGGEVVKVFLESLTLRNGIAEVGGNIYNTAHLTLRDCYLENGIARTGNGGGIYSEASPLALTNCAIQGNRAGFGGGGIYSEDSSPILTNCIILGNSAQWHGGGIHLQGRALNSGFAPVLTNCTIQGNNARYSGGGMYSENSSPSLTNCIIWRNLDPSGSDTADSSVDSFGSISPVYTHCLIQGLYPAGTGNLDGAKSRNDPGFVLEVDPASAPTTGGDLRLNIGSPALDVGLDGVNSEALDFAGTFRTQNAIIDLGAHEGPVFNLATHWSADFDGDGSPNGVEIALGTNPGTADLGHANNLNVLARNDDGPVSLTFGRSPFAPDGTIWKLLRSTTLEPGSFVEIYRFDGATETLGTNISAIKTNTIFTITDQWSPRAFYRFEAVYFAH